MEGISDWVEFADETLNPMTRTKKAIDKAISLVEKNIENDAKVEANPKRRPRGRARRPPRQKGPNAPVAYGSTSRKRDDEVVKSGREYLWVMPGVASVFYRYQVLALNPGIEETFPLLHTTGSMYQFYRFKKLTFHYTPLCPTTSAGFVLMAPIFDSNMEEPLTYVEAMNQAGAVSTDSWNPMTLHINPQNMAGGLKWKRCRSYEVPDTNEDYDSGSLFVGLGGQGGTFDVGSISVEYTVEFRGLKQPDPTPEITRPWFNRYALANHAVTTSYTNIPFASTTGNKLGGVTPTTTPTASNFYLVPGVYGVTVVLHHNFAANNAQASLAITFSCAAPTVSLPGSYNVDYTQGALASINKNQISVLKYLVTVPIGPAALVAIAVIAGATGGIIEGGTITFESI